jgi:hypothetical protein
MGLGGVDKILVGLSNCQFASSSKKLVAGRLAERALNTNRSAACDTCIQVLHAADRVENTSEKQQ